jgi:hypothetical protein
MEPNSEPTQTAHKKFDFRLFLKPVLILVIVFISIIGIKFLADRQNAQKNSSQAPDNKAILPVPLYNLSGIVQAISGNNFTITASTDNRPQTYRVTIPLSLPVSRPPSLIPYNFKIASASAGISAKDLKVGQAITVQSGTGSSLSGKESVTIQAVSLLTTAYAVSGTIESVSPSGLTVRGVVNTLPPNLNSAPSEQKKYTISFDSSTEITQIIYPAGKNQKINSSVLQPDTQVTVYTEDNPVIAASIHALKISSQIITSGAK